MTALGICSDSPLCCAFLYVYNALTAHAPVTTRRTVLGSKDVCEVKEKELVDKVRRGGGGRASIDRYDDCV
jgi:hypothetical protein